MKEICFATNNLNKLKEIQSLLTSYKILSLKEIGCEEELPENQDTLEGNAKEKALFVYEKYKVACFADDTGLEIAALDGAPGVYSARYAGAQRSSEDNMQLVLKNLYGNSMREAQFRTSICYIDDDKQMLFEGIVKGQITQSKTGSDGFGYDPIFQPEGYKETFAEMNMQKKNKISHRALAVQKLVAYLNQH